jgi:hypothetical protein
MYQSAVRLLLIILDLIFKFTVLFPFLTRDNAFGVIVALMSQKDAVYLTDPKKGRRLNRPKRS